MTAPIGLFLPYWGEAPNWVPQFMDRAAGIECLDLIMLGDAAGFMPDYEVKRLPVTMDEFEQRASQCAGIKIAKHNTGYNRGQTLCELRCMFGDVFSDAIARYSWWGWAEFDCVWGDIDSWLTDEMLKKYDMISTAANTVNGPLQFWRNSDAVKQLYKKRLDLIASCKYERMDEFALDAIVKSSGLRSYYLPDTEYSHDRHARWNQCACTGDKLYAMDKSGIIGNELVYFHFSRLNKWPL